MNRPFDPVGSGLPLAGGKCNRLRGSLVRFLMLDRRARVRASTGGADLLTGVVGTNSVSVHRKGGPNDGTFGGIRARRPVTRDSVKQVPVAKACTKTGRKTHS